MKSSDPSTMSPAERMAELAEILAAGIQRFLARESKAVPVAKNSQDHLDDPGDAEAQCGPTPKEAT